MPWSSAIRTRTLIRVTQPQLDGRAPPRRASARQRAARQQRALAHAGQPESAPGAAGRSRARRRAIAHDGRRAVAAQRDGDARRARVLGDVRQPLLHDAVDDELLVAAELVDRACAEVEVACGSRVSARSRSTFVRSAAARPWSSSAAGRSSRARRSSSSSPAWPPPGSRAAPRAALGGASLRRGLAGAAARRSAPGWPRRAGRAPAARARPPGACSTALAVRARSASRRSSMRSKAECRRATSSLSGSGSCGRAEPGRKSTASMAR